MRTPGDTPVSAAGWRLAMAAREPDQAMRLSRFRDAHPGVVIGRAEFGSVRALIPVNGDPLTGREIFGRSLRELLDKLDKAFSPGARGNPGNGLAPGGNHHGEVPDGSP